MLIYLITIADSPPPKKYKIDGSAPHTPEIPRTAESQQPQCAGTNSSQETAPPNHLANHLGGSNPGSVGSSTSSHIAGNLHNSLPHRQQSLVDHHMPVVTQHTSNHQGQPQQPLDDGLDDVSPLMAASQIVMSFSQWRFHRLFTTHSQRKAWE